MLLKNLVVALAAASFAVAAAIPSRFFNLQQRSHGILLSFGIYSSEDMKRFPEKREVDNSVYLLTKRKDEDSLYKKDGLYKPAEDSLYKKDSLYKPAEDGLYKKDSLYDSNKDSLYKKDGLYDVIGDSLYKKDGLYKPAEDGLYKKEKRTAVAQ